MGQVGHEATQANVCHKSPLGTKQWVGQLAKGVTRRGGPVQNSAGGSPQERGWEHTA